MKNRRVPEEETRFKRKKYEAKLRDLQAKLCSGLKGNLAALAGVLLSGGAVTCRSPASSGARSGR